LAHTKIFGVAPLRLLHLSTSQSINQSSHKLCRASESSFPPSRFLFKRGRESTSWITHYFPAAHCACLTGMWRYLQCLVNQCQMCSAGARHLLASVHLSGSVTDTEVYFNACWRESVRPLLFFCSCLPWIIYQPTVLYWKKCLDLYSDNMLLQTFSRCCYDNIASLCDVYKFTSKNLIDIPKHCVCEKLFWTEFAQSRIL